MTITGSFWKNIFSGSLKKQKKEQFFEAVEFFNGCLKVIEGWEKHLQDKVFERKQELYSVLNAAETVHFHTLNLKVKPLRKNGRKQYNIANRNLKTFDRTE